MTQARKKKKSKKIGSHHREPFFFYIAASIKLAHVMRVSKISMITLAAIACLVLF